MNTLKNPLFTLIWFARLFHSVRDQFCTETVGELDLPENCSHDSWISTNSVFPLSSFSSVSGKVLNSLRKWVHGSLEQCDKSQSEVTLDISIVFRYFWFSEKVMFEKLCNTYKFGLRWFLELLCYSFWNLVLAKYMCCKGFVPTKYLKNLNSWDLWKPWHPRMLIFCYK